MCEYCGCQRVPTIADLTAEHDAVVDLIGHVRGALRVYDVDGAAALSRRISAVLDPHIAVEEEALFPAMSADFPEHVSALEDEHHQLAILLGEAATGTPTDPGWPPRLLAGLHTLREHIFKEQDGVFPAALSTLTPEQWSVLDDVRGRVGSALTDSGSRA